MLAVPASLALLVLARPITAVLLQHGAFGADDVERTALALQAYAVGLWPLAVVRVVVPAFYALRDVRTPVLGGRRGAGRQRAGQPDADRHGAAGSVVVVGRRRSRAPPRRCTSPTSATPASRWPPRWRRRSTSSGSSLRSARRLGGLDLRPIAGGAAAQSARRRLPMAAVVYAAARADRLDGAGADASLKALWLGAIIAGGGLAFAAAALASAARRSRGCARCSTSDRAVERLERCASATATRRPGIR